MEKYYILTGTKKKTILATKSFEEAFDFITKNKDTKIRVIDYKASPKIVDRRVFLKDFLDATHNKHKLYVIANILISHENNIRTFYNQIGLAEDLKLRKKTNHII